MNGNYKEGYHCICELQTARKTFKDSHIQEVRDKIDLIELGRDCIGGYHGMFRRVFCVMRDTIASCTDIEKLYYHLTQRFGPGENEYENGVEAIELIVQSEKGMLSAGTYIKFVDDRTPEGWREGFCQLIL